MPRPVPDWLRQLAACPPLDGDVPHGFVRVVADDRYLLFFGENRVFTNVYPFRLGDVERDLAEIRAAAAEHGVTQLDWWVGPDAEPAGLVDRLVALGLVPDERSTAMTLLEEPPAGGEGVTARPVASIDELRVAAHIAHEAFRDRPERLEAVLANLESQWENHEGKGAATFLAFVDGEPIGAARSVYLESPAVLLVSGSVRARDRGKGAYRALVRARWDDAVSRGTPALLVFAGPMSRPILSRVGFEPLFDFEILSDEL